MAVLFDEYDRPVLNVLDDSERARENRDRLRDLHSILKDVEEHIRFVFVTGITMFSKTSFSSGLNNLMNISLYPPLAAICGYTDNDLDTVFAPELEGLDRDRIRTWYNGYNWLGDERLYNPHDILHLFHGREFQAHWFQSSEPGYLYRLLTEKRVSPMQLENCVLDADTVSKFEMDTFSSEALLFQSGYLTIREREVQEDCVLCRLDYPNFEVRSSFNRSLAEHLTARGREMAAAGKTLIQRLFSDNFSKFREKDNVLLDGIRGSRQRHCADSGKRLRGEVQGSRGPGSPDRHGIRKEGAQPAGNPFRTTMTLSGIPTGNGWVALRTQELSRTAA
ncbi:MAG: AAA family ATPase [Gammaproteobacteria bacterium]|nr:AAA family ATPase [Gammaproteobacteria bacterium]